MDPLKESIFTSTLRALFKAIAIIIGIFIAFIPIGIVIGMLGKDADTGDKTTTSYLPDLNGNSQILSPSSPAILRINIQGVIGTKEGVTAEDIEAQLIDSQKGLLKDKRIKGILLYLKTPGGSALDSDTIYRLLLSYKEKFNIPIYAYVDGLCASGGMYIGCSADRIYSSTVGMIGSIGVVIGPFFNVTDALQKLGIESKTITQGKDKDMMSPFRKWKEGEDQSLVRIGSYLYEVFVDIVLKHRPRINRQKLLHEYGAQVFDPPTAEELGYIDVADSSYKEALLDLLHKSDIDPKKPYQIVELKSKKQWLSDLLRGHSPLTSGRVVHEFSIGNFDSKANGFSYLYEPASSTPILIK